MWFFAYGLELWTHDFPFSQRVPGCITGYERRFWLVDDEFVGLPSEPGRIVTLIQTDNPKDMVWGASYEINAEDEESVINLLNFHDKPGYTKHSVTFYPAPSRREQEISTVVPFEVTLYLPTDENKFFVRNEPIEKTAVSIATAEGNAEYLFNLSTQVRDISPKYDDNHMFTLEAVVQYIHANAEILQNA